MPRNPDSRRSQVVMLRVTPDERAAAQRAADRAGVPLSTYLREKALAAARRDLKRAA